MIRWVFLDVGNVLLDEDPLTYLVFRRHVEAVQQVRPGLGFLDLLAAREARAAAGSRWPVYEAVAAELDEARCAEVWARTEREVRARFAALSPAITGAAELLPRLASRYRLGLIANQGRACRARLDELGMLAGIDVVAFSEEQGVFKPDIGLFRRALTMAGADPSHCLMVGDRLDHDVAPAAALGLATAWVRWPRRAAKGWHSVDPDAVAYRASLERSAARVGTRFTRVQPTLVVDEIRALVAAIDRAQSAPCCMESTIKENEVEDRRANELIIE
jgi:HAD superfamily hydrolase (TIGR01549 family)